MYFIVKDRDGYNLVVSESELAVLASVLGHVNYDGHIEAWEFHTLIGATQDEVEDLRRQICEILDEGKRQ